MAAYNEEKLIGRCLDSLISQTFPKENYEIIVVDNNSKDKTSEIVKEKGLRAVFYDKKQGAVWAKNYAASLAKGEIIVITDADTIVPKDWLEKIDEIMEDSRLHAVGGRVESLDEKPISIFIMNLSDYLGNFFQLFGISLIWGSNMAVRKSSFEKVGGINTNLKTGDDWEFVVRIQKKFGIRSTLYTSKLRVKSSPRKQDSLKAFLPYLYIAIVNFISVFILRRSYTVGKHVIVR